MMKGRNDLFEQKKGLPFDSFDHRLKQSCGCQRLDQVRNNYSNGVLSYQTDFVFLRVPGMGGLNSPFTIIQCCRIS